MKFDRKKNSIRNIILGLLNKCVGLIVPFVIRTLIIQKLGAEYLGLNSLFTSVLQMLCLSELGFSSAMVYSMYKPIAEGNDDLVCKMLAFYKKVYTYIGLVVLSLGIILMPFLKYMIASDYPSDINIYVVYLIYLVNTTLSYFLYAYKSSLLNVCLRSDVDSFVTTICNLVMYIIQGAVLLCFSNYYVYAILLPVTTVFINITRSIAVDRMFPQYKPRGKLEKEYIIDIRNRIIGLVGHKLGGVFFSSVDNLVISSFLGLIVLGKYANYYYVFNALNGFMLVIFQAITAAIGNSLVSESIEVNQKQYMRLVFINTVVSGWSSICMLCLYQSFMRFWMGSENMLGLDIAVLLTLYYYIVSVRRVCITYKDAAGMWNEDFWKPYLSVCVNLVVNLILVRLIGLEGVIISSIAALVIVEIPWETHVLFSRYFKCSERNYYFSVLKMTVTFIPILLISLFVTQKFPATFIGLIVQGILCTMIFAIMICIFFWNDSEFRTIRKKICKKGAKL